MTPSVCHSLGSRTSRIVYRFWLSFSSANGQGVHAVYRFALLLPLVYAWTEKTEEVVKAQPPKVPPNSLHHRALAFNDEQNSLVIS